MAKQNELEQARKQVDSLVAKQSALRERRAATQRDMDAAAASVDVEKEMARLKDGSLELEALGRVIGALDGQIEAAQAEVVRLEAEEHKRQLEALIAQEDAAAMEYRRWLETGDKVMAALNDATQAVKSHQEGAQGHYIRSSFTRAFDDQVAIMKRTYPELWGLPVVNWVAQEREQRQANIAGQLEHLRQVAASHRAAGDDTLADEAETLLRRMKKELA